MTRTRTEADMHCKTSRACDDQTPLTDCRCLCDDCTEANLTEIAEWFDELLADRFPGTRRRWHQRRDTEVQAAERKDRDVAERAARFGSNSDLPAHLRPRVTTPPGTTPSPARDDVIDKIAEVTFAVVALRDEVAAELNTGRRQLRVPEACRWIISALPAVKNPRDVAREARRLVDLIRAGTGQTQDVIQLNAACPICGDVTLMAYAARMAVTCVSTECVCDLHDCGCQRGRKHTWQESQLVWLARLVGAEEETA